MTSGQQPGKRLPVGRSYILLRWNLRAYLSCRPTRLLPPPTVQSRLFSQLHERAPRVFTHTAVPARRSCQGRPRRTAPSDPQSKFDRPAQAVVKNLATPDILSLEEIQDNSGATDDGTVAADKTIAKFVDAIKAAGGPAYDWRSIDPVNDQDGGRPGGNIRIVYLFNPARVTFVDRPGGDSTTGGQAVADGKKGVRLSVSPGRINPTSDAWKSSRKPLVGEFTFRGEQVFVVANHFNPRVATSRRTPSSRRR